MVTVPAYRGCGALMTRSAITTVGTAPPEIAKIAASGLELGRLTHFDTVLLPIIAGIRVARRLRPPREVRSDFQLTGGSAVNSSLAAVFSLEARLLARGNLPAGVSILALATAPGD